LIFKNVDLGPYKPYFEIYNGHVVGRKPEVIMKNISVRKDILKDLYSLELITDISDQIVEEVIGKNDHFLLIDMICDTINKNSENALKLLNFIKNNNLPQCFCYICRKEILTGETAYMLGKGSFERQKFEFGEVSVRFAKYFHSLCLKRVGAEGIM